jgi:hypothetical protein
MSFGNFLRLVTLITLCSCRSVLYHKGEQCAPAFAYVDETQKLIDVDASYCSVREYEFALHRVGPINGSDSKKPLQYCDRCVGFKQYTDVATFWETVRQEITKTKKNGR